MSTMISEQDIIETKRYLRKCEKHIFLNKRKNEYFRVSLHDNKFIIHTLCNSIITTKEHDIDFYMYKYYVKYLLFYIGIDDKVISVKKRKDLIF